jgi:hypothetical protein
MQRGINVIALVKETDRYIFLYDSESSATLLQTMGRFAADAELNFSWYDAAVLSQKVRRMNREEVAERHDADTPIRRSR